MKPPASDPPCDRPGSRDFSSPLLLVVPGIDAFITRCPIVMHGSRETRGCTS
nr:hypothetical protein [Candidatus Sigynarchaeum springense]